MQDSRRCEETGRCEMIAVGQKTVGTNTLVPDEIDDVTIDTNSTHAQSTAAYATAIVAARLVPTRHPIDTHQEAADPFSWLGSRSGAPGLTLMHTSKTPYTSGASDYLGASLGGFP